MYTLTGALAYRTRFALAVGSVYAVLINVGLFVLLFIAMPQLADSPVPATLIIIIVAVIFNLVIMGKKTQMHTVVNQLGESLADFSAVKLELHLPCREISWQGKQLRVYVVADGAIEHAVIYLEGTQIAQIDKEMSTVNNCDRYIIYLLPEYEEVADILSIFVLYYDSAEYSSRGQVAVGKSWQRLWTINRANAYYSPEWLKKKFPTLIPEIAGLVHVYRLYNPYSGEHLFTPNHVEVELLRRKGWQVEGKGWSASTKRPMLKVYRLYNPHVGDHFYTADTNEYSFLLNAGWKDDSYIIPAHRNGLAVHRLYNPYAKTGTHHFTVDNAEVHALQQNGWRYEGVAFYAEIA